MYSHEVKTFGIVIFESLYPNEIKTGTELMEGLLKYKKFQVDHMDVSVITIQTKDELIAQLLEIRRKVEEEYLFPIIQFEIHGYDDGICTNTGECISWEVITPILTEINTLLRNLLIIVLGVCKGASIIKYVGIQERAPFRVLIGSSGNITSKQIQEGFHAFYDTFFFDVDVINSIKKLRDVIGSDEIGILDIEDVFDQIFDPRRDPNKFKEIVDNQKNRLLSQHNLLNHFDDETLEKLAIKSVEEIFDLGRSRKAYFLMDDLQNEEKQKIDDELYGSENDYIN